ncbi:MAG: hypothetical protein AMXMBFR56_82590 [Polyangiaceae bacterium]
MTLALAIEDGPRVWLAADSAATSTDEGSAEQDTVREPKVWVRGGWGFAFAGSWRVGALLRLDLDMPPVPRSVDAVERLVQLELPHRVRAVLTREDPEDAASTYLIVAARGAAWSGTLWDLTRSSHGYAAIGVPGASMALAATARLSPRARALAVLHAAAKHQANVRPPFKVERV